jgi:acyl-homoserine-lactone acylase
MKRIKELVLTVTAATLLSACERGDQAAYSTRETSNTPATDTYSAEIRWTRYGVPHIKADSWGDLGFGYAYAVATNGVCVMAEEYATVKGERAKYFGASDENIHSDAFHLALLNDAKVAEYQAAQSESSATMDRGYAAGYNHFIEQNPDKLPARCKDEPWVKPIEEGDIARLTIGVSIRYGLGRVTEAIATATPNKKAMAARLVAVPATMGSNALAFGSELTENGRGLLLGNPHYPWHGGSRFHIAHLTIPGEMDVMGAGLLTTPRLGIGFTDSIAWTHTVSTALRFTMFRLDLVDGNPHAYRLGNETRPIEAIKVAVDIGDGKEERTIYMTHLGPVLSTEDAPWTDEHVYVMRDVNYENYRAGDLYKAIARANNVEELKQALGKYQGAAFVNTIAADKQGGALYADMSAIPNVSAELIERCSTGTDRVNGQRVIMLNGSDPRCDWQVDGSAAAPGLMPPSQQPNLITASFVSNSNDSHWLSNPDHPLQGYSPIIGDEGTQRTLRTRAGLRFVKEVIEQERKFTQPIVQEILFSHRNFGAELFLDDVLSVCKEDAKLAEACEVLAAWDRRQTINSVGAHIYTEFWLAAMEGIDAHYKIPFDPKQPATTPRGLTIDKAETREHLLKAMHAGVNKLSEANIPLDARWGDLQFAIRNDERIGVPGGLAETGMYSMIIPEFNEELGAYNPIVHGNSYIQVVTWDDNGRPDANAILTYSQSPEPDSLNYADMTRLYAKGQWVDMPFTDAEIEAQLVRKETLTR